MKDLRPGPSVLLCLSLACQGVLVLAILLLSFGGDRPGSPGLTLFTGAYLLLIWHGVSLAWVERKRALMALQIGVPLLVFLGMLWRS